MPERRARALRRLAASPAAAATDALLLLWLHGHGLPLIAARAVSLAAGAAVFLLLLRTSGQRRQKTAPGLRPLLAVALLLNYGLFVLLANRAPQLQPLIPLLFSWLAALAFTTFGLWRIRRFRNRKSS